MSRWWRAYDEAVDDPKLGMLSDRAFKRAFYARLAGADNEFSDFLKPYRGRPSNPQWAEIRRAVFERDDFTCTYCGQRGGKLECDHIHPVAKGGSDEFNNLATSCFACNRSKRDKTLAEWQH